MMPVRRSQNWLPSIFNDFFDNEWLERANTTAPAINVIESESNFKVEVAAPGMTKEDFNVTLDENQNLVISMEKKTDQQEEQKEGRFLRREFSYSKFQQTMVIPDNVDKEKISAKVEDGVLKIDLPKLTEEESKKAQKQIEVQQSAVSYKNRERGNCIFAISSFSINNEFIVGYLKLTRACYRASQEAGSSSCFVPCLILGLTFGEFVSVE